jgi:uncharacterized protein
MSTEANREAIRRAFGAWQDEGAPIADVFAPEMTWRIEGGSVVAGAYANRQEFIDRVLAPFGARSPAASDSGPFASMRSPPTATR